MQDTPISPLHSPPTTEAWVTFSSKQWSWNVRNDWASEEFFQRLAQPFDLLEAPSQALRVEKKPRSTQVVRLQRSKEGSPALILKRYRCLTISQAFRTFFKESRAARAFARAFELERLGLLTAKNVALGESQSWRHRDSFYITEEVADSSPLRECRERSSEPLKSRYLIRELARVMARLHCGNFIHTDPSLSNFLVQQGANGSLRIVLVDLDGIRPRSQNTVIDALKDLKVLVRRIPMSAQERLWFCVQYCRERGKGFNGRELHRHLFQPIPPQSDPPVAGLVGALLLIGLALLWLTHASPLDLTSENEDRMSAYVHDMIYRDRWWCPRAADGDLASKPPLFMWISALASRASGGISPLTLYFPSILSAFGMSVGLFFAGRAAFGWRAGWWAGLAVFLSHLGEKQMVTCRYDSLFAFLVFLTAVAALRAWRLQVGWEWFWLAAGAATLTKGPLGVLLGGAGLIAAFWEGTLRRPVPVRGPHTLGITLFTLLTGGWVALAWSEVGNELFEKMLFGELVRHAVGGQSETPLVGFYKPLFTFIGDLAPWSLFSLVAFWRVLRQPAASSDERRTERFWLCAFAVGLGVFSMAAHQRARLALPLMPIGALMAGRELARWTERFTPRKILIASAVLAVSGIAILGLNRRVFNPLRSGVRETDGLRELSALIERRLGPAFPMVHLVSPFGLRHFLGTFPPPATSEQIAEVWSSGWPLVVAVDNPNRLRSLLPTGAPPIHELARWPANGKYSAAIISNRPDFETSTNLVWLYDSLKLRLASVRVLKISGNTFDVESLDSSAFIEVQAFDDIKGGHVSVVVSSDLRPESQSLKAGESLRVEIKGQVSISVQTHRPNIR
jgi:tRNA A-37 threonylcarbamoyl transferase component Bud32